MVFSVIVGDYFHIFLDNSLTKEELETTCSRLFVCPVFVWQLMKIPTDEETTGIISAQNEAIWQYIYVLEIS